MPTAQQLRDLVNSTLGKDTVRLGNDQHYEVDYVPTGLLPIDILMGGGMPMGRFVQLHGDYSTLKSYIGLNIAREMQRRGKVVAIIDTEHSFDPAWAKSVGVNVDDLIVERPATGELAMDIAETLLRGGVGHITFDSVAAMLPETEAKKRLSEETSQPARLAALMSRSLRKLTAANTQNASMLWINQTRVNLGITFGSNEALPGGKALPFYASMIVAVRKTGKLTRDIQFHDGEKWQKGKEQHGQRFKAEVTKSKLNRPFRDVWFSWSMDHDQIDLASFLFAQGVDLGIIENKGNFWITGDMKVLGREKFLTAFSERPDVMLDVENAVRTHYGLSLIEKPKQSQTVKPKVGARTSKKTVAKKGLVKKRG